MTIRMQFSDGTKQITRTYRKIYKNKNFAEMVEGFYAQRDGMEWGILTQLKGKERIVLHTFGNKQ